MEKQRLFIRAILIATLLISGFSIFYYIKIKQNLTQNIIDTYNVLLTDLASQVSMDLKIRNITGLKKIIDNSYLKEKVKYLYIISNDNSFTFLVEKERQHLNTTPNECTYTSISKKIYFNQSSIGLFNTCVDISKYTNVVIPKHTYLVFILFLLFIATLLIFWLRLETSKLEYFVNTFKNIKVSKSNSVEGINIDPELLKYGDKVLRSAYKKLFYLLQNVQNHQRKYLQYKSLEKTKKRFRQVSHDIRSPLSALNSIVNFNKEYFPDDVKFILVNSAKRIEDIANSLTSESELGTNYDSNIISSVLIINEINKIISEKRIQLKNKSKIKINFSSSIDDNFIFAYTNQIEFKRVLSNIINNSIESFSNNGCVDIITHHDDDHFYISVKDNGIGIPNFIINNIFDEGFTYGKAKGSGLGLFHAINEISKWGGSIKVESNINEGTHILISLKKSPAPEWWVDSINLKKYKSIIIIDDEDSIHLLWNRILNNFIINNTVTVFYFKSPTEVQSNHINSETLFLVDHEYKNIKLLGAEWIVKNSLQENSILVTNNFDQYPLQEFCISKNIKLLPKTLIYLIKIISN